MRSAELLFLLHRGGDLQSMPAWLPQRLVVPEEAHRIAILLAQEPDLMACEQAITALRADGLVDLIRTCAVARIIPLFCRHARRVECVFVAAGLTSSEVSFGQTVLVLIGLLTTRNDTFEAVVRELDQQGANRLAGAVRRKR